MLLSPSCLKENLTYAVILVSQTWVGTLHAHTLYMSAYEHVFHTFTLYMYCSALTCLFFLQFQSIDCVFTDEPFMLQSEIHCMSPWQLKIVDSNYRWNSTVSTASQVPDQVKNCKHTSSSSSFSSSSSSSSCFLPPSQSPLPHHFTFNND